MAETHETIADIIAEMRGIRVREFQEYADRLEAAHRRELAAARREPRTWGECVAEYQKRKEAGEYGPY